MNPVLADRLALLDSIKLDHGGHPSFEKGHCAMEVVAWLAGREHSDQPPCVSPVLGAFLRNWNDALDDEGRQMLKPFLPRVIGTADDGHDEERAWMCTDWLVRVCAPAWLELAGVKDAPRALRGLPPLVDAKSAKKAQPKIDKARKDGDAAWDAAWDAATDAARDAATDAARDAAWDAARDAARDAAWDAAWAAARAAAWDAARAAAWAAARAAAWDAARDAATKSLEPTVIELQASARDLLDRMIALGEDQRAGELVLG